jgi:hypothetical protein
MRPRSLNTATTTRTAEAVAGLVDLDLHRHAHLDLLTSAWKLRESLPT